MQRVIDVHIHYNKNAGFDEIAQEAHHLNSVHHVQSAMAENSIVLAVAMGTGRKERENAHLPGLINLGGELDVAHYNQGENICYCLGINSEALNDQTLPQTLAEARYHLERCPHCVGFKMYPGYNYVYVHDPIHREIYDLAREFDVPVCIHTGETASSTGVLKYAHPLTIDEAAVRYPDVRFVMCHMGNPWIMDACEVAAKNPNVYMDMSGLGEGYFTKEDFLTGYSDYVTHIKTWLTYLGDYSKVMYGTDWPLVNMKTYLETMMAIIPPAHHDAVFYQNALRVFPRIKQFIK